MISIVTHHLDELSRFYCVDVYVCHYSMDRCSSDCARALRICICQWTEFSAYLFGVLAPGDLSTSPDHRFGVYFKLCLV